MTTDTIRGLEERLRAGLEGVTPGPWQYRPLEHDDWGVVRGKTDVLGMTPFVVQARQPYQTEDQLNEHRRNRTDPWERDARHIANCSPDNILALLDALRTAIAQLKEARAALAESDKHAEKIEALLEPHISWEGQPSAFDAMKARAEAAEARLEEQDASWRETLRIERDARLNENRLKMKATARLEEAKAVLEPFAAIAETIRDNFPDDYHFEAMVPQAGHLRAARAFLHQGGSE